MPHRGLFHLQRSVRDGAVTTARSERHLRLPELPTLTCSCRPPAPLAGATAVSFPLPQAATRYVCPQTVFKPHPGFDALLRGVAIDLGAEAACRLPFPSVPCRRRSRTETCTPQLKTDGAPVTI
jgi:hypothetical protein